MCPSPSLQSVNGNLFGGYTDTSWSSRYKKGRYVSSSKLALEYRMLYCTPDVHRKLLWFHLSCPQFALELLVDRRYATILITVTVLFTVATPGSHCAVWCCLHDLQ